MVTKKIFVAGGHFVIVDEENYQWLRRYKWHLAGSMNYATTDMKYKDKDGTLHYCKHRMHRLINQTPEGMLTDHINGNVWDNRKCNLRTVNGIQNQSNIVNCRYNKILPGVQKHKSGFRAAITCQGKRYKSKTFHTPEEAHKEYLRMRTEFNKEVFKTE